MELEKAHLQIIHKKYLISPINFYKLFKNKTFH